MEMITVCPTPAVTSYDSMLKLMTTGLHESGAVCPALTDFVHECLQHIGQSDVDVPTTENDLITGHWQFHIRPQLVVVTMNPADVNFRKDVLAMARKAGLTALDHQNGYLFVPPPECSKPWWKFW